MKRISVSIVALVVGAFAVVACSTATSPTKTTGGATKAPSVSTRPVTKATAPPVPTTAPTTTSPVASPTTAALPTTTVIPMGPTATIAPTTIGKAPSATMPPGFKKFVSGKGGYVIGVPQGWTARSVSRGGLRMDIFEDQSAPGVRVAILHQTVPAIQGLSPSQLIRQVSRTGYANYVRVGKIRVDGKQATLLRASRRGVTVEQAVWAKGQTVWVATLSGPSGRLKAHEKEFREMLSTLHTIR